ncbi:hypothetical protein [Marinifilum sp. D737]|uniref:hypothetical protein n=1 Tax=Marinifilum sp. D737 TaxID=2969628 RepID=UPI002272C187|nr:hypothetical protein [Marinifilum sp. D737]MCY1636319.1 hypothetical protein [Marinifilum sp. D737]
MKPKVFQFLFYSIIFSVGIFVGEWLLDLFTNADRYPIVKEIKDAIFIGVFVSLLLVFVNKFRE